MDPILQTSAIVIGLVTIFLAILPLLTEYTLFDCENTLSAQSNSALIASEPLILYYGFYGVKADLTVELPGFASIHKVEFTSKYKDNGDDKIKSMLELSLPCFGFIITFAILTAIVTLLVAQKNIYTFLSTYIRLGIVILLHLVCIIVPLGLIMSMQSRASDIDGSKILASNVTLVLKAGDCAQINGNMLIGAFASSFVLGSILMYALYRKNMNM